ncbi:MAG: helix-turn-helix transcriptional regulator [Gammaproteobacteria bacterium]
MLPSLYKHPSFTYADDISYLCEPLKKLNISYFSHVRIDNKKQFSTISSNPAFLQHYLKNKYYVTDIHMVNEKQFGDFFVWDGMQFSAQSAQLCVEAAGFKVHNPFTIIEKRKDCINYYHFANATRTKQINQVYLANIDLLKLFISQFNDHVRQSKSLSNAYTFKFNLAGAQQVDFEETEIALNRDEFSKELNLNTSSSRKLYFENAVLSKRQSEILQHVIRGKTLKEIAHILGLSQHTVQHYFEMLKIKLNVHSKSELILKTLDSDSIKLLEEK